MYHAQNSEQSGCTTEYVWLHVDSFDITQEKYVCLVIRLDEIASYVSINPKRKP